MPLEVRLMQAEDLNRIKRFMKPFSGREKHLVPEWEAIERAAGHKAILPLEFVGHVAETVEGGKRRIVGIATMNLDYNTLIAKLDHVFVHPAYRRKGIGEKLVKARLVHAFERWNAKGASTWIAKHTSARMPKAYEALGFERGLARELVLRRENYLKKVARR